MARLWVVLLRSKLMPNILLRLTALGTVRRDNGFEITLGQDALDVHLDPAVVFKFTDATKLVPPWGLCPNVGFWLGRFGTTDRLQSYKLFPGTI